MADMPILTGFLIVLLTLLSWYAIGMQYNVRLARRALAWLEHGLPVIGEKAALNWSGVSSVEIQLNKAKDPFRSASFLLLLTPRELPGWWWWRRRQDPHDSLVFRAQLRVAPHFDLVAHSPHVAEDEQLRRSGAGQWTPVQGGVVNSMNADIRGSISPYTVNRLIMQTTLDGIHLTRLAIHRTVPNVEVHYQLPELNKVSTMRVLTSLKQLGEEIESI